MKPGFEKYIPFQQIKLENREWPNNVITKAPIWCSVDSVSYTHLTLPTT